MKDDTVYLDHAATTPLRPAVRTAMAPYLDERFGNPSSTHAAGREARSALEGARARVAELLGAAPEEIVFTGGGTEADNLAVLGRWRAARSGVALSAIEHSAVRASAAQAGREGAVVSTVAVNEAGRVDLDALDEILTERHAVVSIMWANNEVGSIQPIAEVAERCRGAGAAVHTDAVQAVGHIPVSLDGIDLLSLSAHKFGGPKGVGALYVRDGVTLEPRVFGGGQERGRRGGTSNVAGAVGLAKALAVALEDLDSESRRLGTLRDRLARGVLAVAGVTRHTPEVGALPHVLNVGVDGVGADLLHPSLDLAGLAVSAGSACHSGTATPSHVLLAMGRDHGTAVRFSLGWTTSAGEVDRAVDVFVGAVRRLRRSS